MGVGAFKEIGKEISMLVGIEPFISTDQDIVASGILDQVVVAIGRGCVVETMVYSKTLPNPTANNVHEGLDGYKENGCELIVSQRPIRQVRKIWVYEPDQGKSALGFHLNWFMRKARLKL